MPSTIIEISPGVPLSNYGERRFLLHSQNATCHTVTPSYFVLASITNDSRPLPPPASTPAEDDEILADEPWVIAPIHADYGINIKLGIGAFINFNATFVDTCPITIGARTLVGPNCSFFSGTHPVDPAVRMGTTGPELGNPIEIGEDCWFGGNVIVLPGITIGRGCSIGAGSVVTKVSAYFFTILSLANTSIQDIPAFHIAAGNPARVLRKIETAMDPFQATTAIPANELVEEGTEAFMADQ